MATSSPPGDRAKDPASSLAGAGAGRKTLVVGGLPGDNGERDLRPVVARFDFDEKTRLVPSLILVLGKLGGGAG